MEPGTLRIEPAGGPSWLVTLGPHGSAAASSRRQDGPADVTVSGSATDIYLWVWNRPATVSVTGVTAVAERWKQIRVRWN